MEQKTNISIHSKVHIPIKDVWNFWTNTDDIVYWNTASADWHTTHAINNLREGGTFSYRMEAKNGSVGFDFSGSYTAIIFQKRISILLDDGRNMSVEFVEYTDYTDVIETFEAEQENTIELQRNGWQAILNNFQKYAEEKYKNSK